MNYKTLFQVFLIILVLLVSSIFYFKYFYSTNTVKNQNNKTTTNIKNTSKFEGNTIKEIVYESFDNNGNNYIINSDLGTFSDNNKEEVLMTNVRAKIILKNGININLKSRNAKYNTQNSNTNFFNNVELNYLNHRINSDNIDILFTDSKLEAFNNLVYRNSDINLMADKVELDLITKDTKIFMFDNSRVKIIKD
tara:strand:+ start:991 stop:1572 length:582 start_codon:yes stop_codon:yes gene_type:complete